MMRALLFIFSAAFAFAAELVIPNQSPVGWEPGAVTGVGVVGGIDQYRPGGASARTVLHNVVTTYGADNTGASNCVTEVGNAVSACGTNEVVFYPYGVFRQDGQVYYSNKSNFTFRGSGSGVRSTSSNTLAASGTKVFTVASGLGWTTGCGVRVWKQNDDSKWMQGTCSSYSGTTLTIAISSSSGDTDTLSAWTISQTHIDRSNSVAGPVFGNASSAFNYVSDVSVNAAAGATTITVPNGGLYTSGEMITTAPLDQSEIYNVKAYKRGRTQVNKITGIAGNVLTLAVPLYFALNTSENPQVSSAALYISNVGIEDFSMSGSDSNGEGFVNFNNAYNCWAYNVRTAMTLHYNLQMGTAVRCEFAFCVGTLGGMGSSTANLNTGVTAGCLFRNNVLDQSAASSILTGNNFGDAFLYNYFPSSVLNTNHGQFSAYILFENNIGIYTQSDGYFSGAWYYTYHRNWLTGSGGAAGWIIHNRWNRWHNIVGNVMGRSGVANGVISNGNPNISNSSFEGTSNSVLYTESGGVSGSLQRQVDAAGNARIFGTVASSTGSSVTITLTAGTEADLSDPYILTNEAFPFSIAWGTFQSSTVRDITIDRGASSGTTIVFTGTATYPANGTTVYIYPGNIGYQERDDAVDYTTFYKQNFMALQAGGGSIEDPLTGGDTLANSLAYNGTPSDWPSGMSWPPNFSTTSPPYDVEVIPAGYYYVNGVWPTGGGGGGSGNATVAGNTTVTNTLTVP